MAIKFRETDRQRTTDTGSGWIDFSRVLTPAQSIVLGKRLRQREKRDTIGTSKKIFDPRDIRIPVGIRDVNPRRIVQPMPSVLKVLPSSPKIPTQVIAPRAPTAQIKLPPGVVPRAPMGPFQVGDPRIDPGARRVIPKPKVPPEVMGKDSHLYWPGADVVFPNKIGGNKMPLDLGSLISEGLGLYADYKTRPKATPIAFNPGALNPFSDVPIGEVFDTPTAMPSGSFCVDKYGNITKKRRRRRRRLATASDIKDLASLSAVTTPAEKKTWIATHPS